MPHASRVALITGCGKPVGIGNSTARALAAKGDRSTWRGQGNYASFT